MFPSRKPMEDDLQWLTSSFCNNSSCVEVALVPGSGYVAIRDNRQTGLSHLFYTNEEWAQFVAGVKNGEFDLN